MGYKQTQVWFTGLFVFPAQAIAVEDKMNSKTLIELGRGVIGISKGSCKLPRASFITCSFSQKHSLVSKGQKKKKKTPNMAEKSRHPLLLSSWRDLETGEEILPGPPAHPESQPLDPGSADSWGIRSLFKEAEKFLQKLFPQVPGWRAESFFLFENHW